MYCLTIKYIENEQAMIFRKNGILHRVRDLPAVIHSDGEKQWCRNGKWHRDNDLPAIICANGEEFLYTNGVKYVIIEQENGTKEYYEKPSYSSFNLHRMDLPSIIYPNGDVEYWEHGKRHRDNGPAVIYGDKQYWFQQGEFQKCTV